MKNLLLPVFIFVFCFSYAQPDLLLPDGKPFKYWEDSTRYSKIYHVAQNHPEASDKNPGTAEQPFKTINQAAEILKPGEKVIVHAGVYREFLRPENGGIGKSKMIAYETAKGEKVVISGAETVKSEWSVSIASNGQPFSLKLWQTELPEHLFAKDNPFKTPNANDEEIDLMPWALAWKGQIPYTLPRAMVFQNDQRMTQMAAYEDLIKLPGSYWVAPDGETIHIHPFNQANPNNEKMEVTTRQQLFKPQNVGTSFIHVKGFQFEKAGNGFPRIGVGAVFVNGGHHWIIENNTVCQCNSVGIEIGARVTERSVSSEQENQQVKNHPGGFIVKNNTVFDCGTGGIQGHNNLNTLIFNNHIYNIGWQDVERYWECAGIKILIDVNTVVCDNVIHDVESASAIWLDWDIRNSRITRNIIYNIAPNYNGTVFIEASQVPNLIDNNFFWNIQTIGVSLYDTDLTTVTNNFFGHVKQAISSRVNTNRSLNGRPLTSKDNRIVHNIFYQVKEESVIQSKANFSDFNLFASGNETQLINWQSKEWDINSVQIPMKADFNEDNLELTIKTDESFPVLTHELPVSTDLFGSPRSKQVPGPFCVQFKGEITFKLD